MNYLLVIGILLFGGVVFYGCKSVMDSKKEPNSQNSSMGLSKSSCKGTCEEYNLMVNSNKIAIYKGIKNVDRVGVFSAQLSDSQFDDLKKLLESKNFSSHKTDYTAPIADLQKFTMTYDGHTVLFQRKGGPRDLFPVIEAFDNLIKDLDWKATE